LLRRTVGSNAAVVRERLNTFFAGEIVSQARRKTPTMVAKIRQPEKIFEIPRNNGERGGVD